MSHIPQPGPGNTRLVASLSLFKRIMLMYTSTSSARALVREDPLVVLSLAIEVICTTVQKDFPGYCKSKPGRALHAESCLSAFETRSILPSCYGY